MGSWGIQVTHKYANVHNSPIMNVFTQPLHQEIPREILQHSSSSCVDSSLMGLRRAENQLTHLHHRGLWMPVTSSEVPNDIMALGSGYGGISSP